MTDGFAEHLHYLSARSVIETGHAPDLGSLSGLAGRCEKETADGLRHLQEIQGVILFPIPLTCGFCIPSHYFQVLFGLHLVKLDGGPTARCARWG